MAQIALRGVSKTFSDGSVGLQEFDMDIADGEFLILVGPSGCGKSTALRLIAGLDEPTTGEILIDGASIDGVEPADRDVAMVFQSYALYPHLSVRKNLGFPLRMNRVAKEEIKARVEQTAALLELTELLPKLPGELSGGQRQRVAMGRAMIRQPKAFLMDEPLSNLDAKLRVQMRAQLARLHEQLGITTVYVTHDQVEAMTLGQRVAVMDRGVVKQVAAPTDLYDHPADTYVAAFLGSPPMNFLAGRIRDGQLSLAGSKETVRLEGPAPSDREVIVGIRPEDLRPDSSNGDPGLRLPLMVDVVERLGTDTVVYGSSDGLSPLDPTERESGVEVSLAVRLHGRDEISARDRLDLHARPADLHLFDAESQRALTLEIASR